MGEIGDADRFDRHVGVAGDHSVHGNEIIVAVILDPAAGEVDESLHVRAGRRRLLQKVAQSRAQGLAVEVARADDVEAGGLQSLRDKPRIVGGRRQRRVAIGRISDDERDARIGRPVLGSRALLSDKREEDRKECGEDCFQLARHRAPHQR
jgi:hypothetical protein